MTPWAFNALLDAYCRARVDLELCHMNGYDKKKKRVSVIQDKLMDIYYQSDCHNEILTREICRQMDLHREQED